MKMWRFCEIYFRTVVTLNIAASYGLYSSLMKRSRSHNSSLFTIGTIDVDIPQHPVILHGMMSRGSKRLSSTLKEFQFRHTAHKAKLVFILCFHWSVSIGRHRLHFCIFPAMVSENYQSLTWVDHTMSTDPASVIKKSCLTSLTKAQHHTLTQLQTNTSPFFLSYLHIVTHVLPQLTNLNMWRNLRRWYLY